MACSRKPKNTFRKEFNSTKKISDDLRKLDIKGPFSFSYSFNKKRNSKIYQIKTIDPNNLLKVTDQELTEEEKELFGDNSPVVQKNLDYYGEIYFPNLTETTLKYVKIVPLFEAFNPNDYISETSSEERETGFLNQDNFNYGSLFKFQGWWRKSITDSRKGFYYQFYLQPLLDNPQECGFTLRFQAFNDNILMQVQHRAE